MKKIILIPVCLLLVCVFIVSGYVFNDMPQEDRELYRAANDNFRKLHPEHENSSITVIAGSVVYHSVVMTSSDGQKVTVDMSPAAYELYKEGMK